MSSGGQKRIPGGKEEILGRRRSVRIDASRSVDLGLRGADGKSEPEVAFVFVGCGTDFRRNGFLVRVGPSELRIFVDVLLGQSRACVAGAGK